MNLFTEIDNKDPESQTLSDDINWIEIFDLIKRFKKSIFTFTSLGFLAGCLFAISQKRIWQGQFEIVLAPDDSMQSPIGTQSFANLISLGGGNSEINTQVEILKSPSVLMPIFEDIKIQKKKLGQNVDKWKYQNWFNESVKIDIKKGTTVLFFNYRDHDKDLILPTLNKVSETFRSYSGDERLTGIEDGIKYLDNQIDLYRIKSNKSSSEAIEYSIDNKLTYEQFGSQSISLPTRNFNPGANLPLNFFPSSNLTDQPSVTSGYSMDLSEVMKDLKLVESKIAKLNDSAISNDQILAISSNIKDNSVYSILAQLNKLEIELANAKTYYKENDIALLNIKRQKKQLQLALEKNARIALNNKKTDLMILAKSIERPKEVILKFRELTSQAARDQSTLSALLQQRRVLSLDLARKSNPWKLITKATLSDYPAGTSRKLIAMIGLISGFIIGLILAFYKSLKDKIIYSEKKFQELIPIPLILKLSDANKNNWSDDLKIIASSPKLKNENNVGLISIGETKQDSINVILEKCNSLEILSQINFITDFSNLSKFSSLIIIFHLGRINENQVNSFIEKVKLFDVKFLGLIVIED